MQRMPRDSSKQMMSGIVIPNAMIVDCGILARERGAPNASEGVICGLKVGGVFGEPEMEDVTPGCVDVGTFVDVVGTTCEDSEVGDLDGRDKLIEVAEKVEKEIELLAAIDVERSIGKESNKLEVLAPIFTSESAEFDDGVVGESDMDPAIEKSLLNAVRDP